MWWASDFVVFLYFLVTKLIKSFFINDFNGFTIILLLISDAIIQFWSFLLFTFRTIRLINLPFIIKKLSTTNSFDCQLWKLMWSSIVRNWLSSVWFWIHIQSIFNFILRLYCCLGFLKFIISLIATCYLC